jgi:hypothetical protein
MRRLVIAGALALMAVMMLALPLLAAELTGGCTLQANSFDQNGAPLETGTVPPGTEGTDQNPFRIAWNGRVDFRFTTGTTVFANNVWAVYAAGIPFPILSGSDDNPMDLDESGNVTIGPGVPGPVVGLFYVTGFIEGNGGTSRCDGNGWVQIVGDPLATIPFWLAVALLVLGAALLVATPYGGTWEEGGRSPMPSGSATPPEVS